MRFKSFKDFSLSKPKEKSGYSPGEEDQATEQITQMGERLNGHIKDLEETAQQIQQLADSTNGDKDAKPHGPLGELSIEPDDQSGDEILDVNPPEIVEEVQEQVKLVEVNMEEETASAEAEPSPAPASEDSINPLNNLFDDEEEEDNPLANLIKSMPDYTTQEITDDLKELQRIIQEWQRDRT